MQSRTGNYIALSINLKALIITFTLVLNVGFNSTIALAQSSKATLVVVDRVLHEPLAQTIPVIGRLVASQSGIVAARTTAPLGEIHAQVGDRVKKGDVIAVLIKDALKSRRALWLAQVSQAKSRIGTTTAQLELREQELKRLKSLEASAAFSQARLDDKKQEVAVIKSTISENKAALDVTRANLELAEIELSNADIRAPYDGVIVIQHTNTGSFVRAGDPVVSLINDSNLEIEADIPTERLHALMTGTMIQYQLTVGGTNADAGMATVRAIIPNENPLTRTRSVRFSATFKDNENLAVNQSIILLIPISVPRDILSVHKDAIVNKAGKTIVYVAKDGKANLRPVKLGEAVGNRFEVLTGLNEGDKVVVRGNERLRPNQKITFKNDKDAG